MYLALQKATWALKRLQYHDFGVYVYTIELHGTLGTAVPTPVATRKALNTGTARGAAAATKVSRGKHPYKYSFIYNIVKDICIYVYIYMISTARHYNYDVT